MQALRLWRVKRGVGATSTSTFVRHSIPRGPGAHERRLFGHGGETRKAHAQLTFAVPTVLHLQVLAAFAKLVVSQRLGRLVRSVDGYVGVAVLVAHAESTFWQAGPGPRVPTPSV
eukprot:scaffold40832_cov63-Phaeocystis_antarctica.AAC.3